MGLLRSLFWFAIFLASTFVFTVIFEHGFTDFQKNAKSEFELLKGYMAGGPKRKADESDKLPQ
jgi:hypothetical protein